jgi:hypothetical protein
MKELVNTGGMNRNINGVDADSIKLNNPKQFLLIQYIRNWLT